jgi:sodium transport system permease protein
MGIALLAVAVSMLLSFYLGSYWQGQNAVLGLLATQWLLILVPTVALLWYVRVDLREALSLRVPLPAPFMASVIMAGAWVILAIQTSVWQSRLLPMPEELEQALKDVFNPAMTGVGVWGMVFAAAVSPAVCEEVLYRGALLSGLRERLPGWALIGVVGLFFGMAHFSVHRAPVVILSGMVLAYVVWRSGSLFLGMLVHVVHNTFGVLGAMERLPEPVQEFLLSDQVEQHGLPGWILAVAMGGLVFGVFLMERWARKNRIPR